MKLVLVLLVIMFVVVWVNDGCCVGGSDGDCGFGRGDGGCGTSRG